MTETVITTTITTTTTEKYTEEENCFQFALLDEGAKFPTKREEDGCYDLYVKEGYSTIINPHQIALLPTGLCSAFDPKYRIAFRERGSNTKSGLIIMAGQIDSGYRGEWFVAVYNTNDVPVVICEDEDYSPVSADMIVQGDVKLVTTAKAICQFAVEEVPNIFIEQIESDVLQAIPSERGGGNIGSSGK